eukprot:COSAG06_NODE_5619_length_3356_cov_3.849555_2_plen_163_part_00
MSRLAPPQRPAYFAAQSRLLISFVSLGDRGSHLHPHRGNPIWTLGDDNHAKEGWLSGRTHSHPSKRGEPLRIEHLACPPGTVIPMWTHAAHAVQPKQPDTPMRYTLITAYRQPRCHEVSKWITPAFYNRRTVGLAADGKDFTILDGAGEPLPSPPGKDLFRP